MQTKYLPYGKFVKFFFGTFPLYKKKIDSQIWESEAVADIMAAMLKDTFYLLRRRPSLDCACDAK